MSATDDEIKIDLDEIDRNLSKKPPKAAPVPDVEVVQAEPEVKQEEKKVVKPEEGLAVLKKQVEAERAGRENAERRASEAEAAELRSRTESQDTNLHLVTTAIEKVEQQNVILKANLRQAIVDNDADAQVEIQASMAESAANLLQLKQGKAALEKAPKPVARAAPDPVEQFAATLSPRAAGWIRSHPDFVTDGRKNEKMIAAHNFIKNDIELDSDQYFEKIEEMLGIKKAAPSVDVNLNGGDPMADAAKPVRQTPPAGAPVSRSGNGTGGRSGAITLTPEQQEIARLNFPDSKTPLEDYARQIVALRQEGKLN